MKRWPAAITGSRASKRLRKRTKRHLKELEEKQQATAAALAKLQQRREEAIGEADKMAEELAKEKPEESSELYRKALGLFLDGKIDEALEVLSADKLERMAAQAREMKAKAEKQIADTVQAWLLRGSNADGAVPVFRGRKNLSRGN